jgi:hypothetical protein
MQGESDGTAWYAPRLGGEADWVKFEEYGRGVKDAPLIEVIHILIPQVVMLDLREIFL